MKLILTQEVTGLGEPGDIVEVKNGYGRNYLVPQGKAVAWTKGGEKQVTQIRAARDARAVQSLEEAQAIRDSLQAKTISMPVRAGANGRLFGAVTTADVAKVLGTSVDRRKVELANPIKSTGDYTVLVRLHPEVQAKVNLQVVAEA